MTPDPQPKRSTRCHRCGGLLGMGRTMLYRSSPSQTSQDPQDLERLRRQALRRTRRIRLHWPYGIETFCGRCGIPSAFEGRFDLRVSGGKGFLQRLYFLLDRLLDSNFREAQPPLPINLAHLPSAARFPVYGFKGRPLGLRFRHLGAVNSWSGRVAKVALTYAPGAGDRPATAVMLSQGPKDAKSRCAALAADLRLAMTVVRGYGSMALQREYSRSGNIHRDWNLDAIRAAERRHASIQIGGDPVSVEWSRWWTPQPVVLVRAKIKRVQFRAASVGMTPIELLTALKTMAPLRIDREALEEHQEDYEQ